MEANNRKILHNLFDAYFLARKNKRGTMSQLKFEIAYEKKLLELGREISNGSYSISKSFCFISFKPLKREIFAADFRDRIIHHLIFTYISPIFERLFINDSYSCRTGKGTLYGIKRLDHFIRSCSENYKSDCYVLKLDIKGYFMSIDKNILYKKIEEKLNNVDKVKNKARAKAKQTFDTAWLIKLIHQIMFHDPTKDCVIKGSRENWRGLPKSKSLFFTKKDTGLPIGNLTSQLFGNIYLNDFDHFVKYGLVCKYYGRYVDDMVIVHKDKEYLKSIIPIMRQYLKDELLLELHPKKIYLQHINKGVLFLGAFIKPYRIYIRNCVKDNFCKKIQDFNGVLQKSGNPSSASAVSIMGTIDSARDVDKDADKNNKKAVACINSYLGMMSHFDTYKLRKKILSEYLSVDLKKVVHINKGYDKVSLVLFQLLVIFNQ